MLRRFRHKGAERRSNALDKLAECLVQRKHVVVISGAGLSAPSGVPVFRGEQDAIWVQRATSLGTKAAFLKDPLQWYNEFWFPLFKHEYTRLHSNMGHEAIACMANLVPDLVVVSQNIDTLHQQTRTSWSAHTQLIEIHGRLGLYHCSSDDGHCELATETVATASDIFPFEVAQAIEESRSPIKLTEVPRCKCGKPIMPLALMFDEDYTSHAFYQFDRAMQAFEVAEALVFVGTSFSVNITSLALAEARARSLPCFNFNLRDPLSANGKRFEVYNLLGPAEERLPEVVEIAQKMCARQGEILKAGECHVETDRQKGGFGYVIDPAQPSRPLSRGDVIVEFSSKYARKEHSDPKIQQQGEKLWSDLQAHQRSLYNANKFRLARAELRSCDTKGSSATYLGQAALDPQSLVLSLGLTDYKSFRLTNCSPDVARLQEDGIRDWQDAEAYLAQKLGVGSVVCTSDAYIVLLRRSADVCEGQGLLDVPGGHPEPAELRLSTTGDGAQEESLEGLVHSLPGQLIVDCIFSSALEEVTAEVNLAPERLSEPLLLGIVRQATSAGCPSMAFFISSNCTKDEVEARYWSGGIEKEESTEVVLIRRADLKSLDSCKLTSSAQGTLALYLKLVKH